MSLLYEEEMLPTFLSLPAPGRLSGHFDPFMTWLEMRPTSSGEDAEHSGGKKEKMIPFQEISPKT